MPLKICWRIFTQPFPSHWEVISTALKDNIISTYMHVGFMHVHTWNEAGKQWVCLHCCTLTPSISAWTWSFLAKSSLSLCLLHSFSSSLSFLPPSPPFSADYEPAGRLIEDAFLRGTKVILFRQYGSLSKADTLLKNYSPHWAPQKPVERFWKGL